jgi:CheY-like chemotaxis protein
VPAPASILIADDDEISARFLKRLLLREGHHVSIVTTADEVLSACATTPPDLVVIDLVAPRGHGFEVCRRLKDQPNTRFIPIVIVTSQNDRHERLRASPQVPTTS